MAETEVESILREIRERVLSEQRVGKDVTAARQTNTNGGGESDELQLITTGDHEALSEEHLSLIKSYLTVTARGWDRLPPLVSNRSGLTARLELWLKRQLKRATRWFTWEQVNFNAAVHHALRDLLPVLSAHEHELQKLRAQIAAAEARRIALETELEQYQSRLTAQLNDLRSMIETERRATELQRNQVDARFATLTREVRERDEQIQDEQRVCFKQLALEASEAAVLEDRARRALQASLAEIERRIAGLENERQK